MPLQSKTRYRPTPAMVREGIRVLGKRSSVATTWQTKAKTRRGPLPSPRSVGDAAYTPVGQVGPAYKKRKRDTRDRDLSLVSLLSLPDEELIVALREVGIFTPICPCGAEVKPAPYLKEAGGSWYWQCTDWKECNRRVSLHYNSVFDLGAVCPYPYPYPYP
jgi:hypothetical protein